MDAVNGAHSATLSAEAAAAAAGQLDAYWTRFSTRLGPGVWTSQFVHVNDSTSIGLSHILLGSGGCTVLHKVLQDPVPGRRRLVVSLEYVQTACCCSATDIHLRWMHLVHRQRAAPACAAGGSHEAQRLPAAAPGHQLRQQRRHSASSSSSGGGGWSGDDGQRLPVCCRPGPRQYVLLDQVPRPLNLHPGSRAVGCTLQMIACGALHQSQACTVR